AALGPVFTTCSPTFFVILATVLPQSFGMGVIDLLAYIAGLAIILIAVASVGQRIIDRLGWATNPNGWFRRILGALFIILGVAIIAGLDKKIETAILGSGFFDVTSIEQSIHQRLAGADSAGIDGTIVGTSTALSGVQLANEGRYTEIVEPAGFLNSAPFKLADFIGKKVILVDFIDYTCINCQRTFPYLESWWNSYKDQGLEVVAIHTPEFSFEQDINNVRMGLSQFGITFPVVLDNKYATWNAYGNEYWPHKYLIDIHGNVVYDHIGEGGYGETEAAIVALLSQRKQVLGEAGAITVASSSVPTVNVLTDSPETYFGAMRNEYFGNGAPGQKGQGIFTLPAVSSMNANEFYLGGSWSIADEYAETTGADSEISYTFAATKVYMIALTADGKPATAHVLIDGRPIPPPWMGDDVTGSGVLTIDQSRLYRLYANPTLEQHRLEIIFKSPGVRIYTFTFG
ncbi:MAG: redoxin domain-containing protein, partial [Patescibacteria group bacterium]|nr:redoxin domain-containing protein [Patescibacteria group bacterium]